MKRSLLMILSGPSSEVAERLLGSLLIREIGGQELIGKIVETEAYDQFDAASHSYRGSTPRTEVMFGPPGHLYVYFTYGMHYCCNVVCGPKGFGAAVLIRALEPLQGEDIMARQRSHRAGTELTNGPAKLCQALSINMALNGHDLLRSPLRLELRPKQPTKNIVKTTRIGISKAKDAQLRFYLADSKYVSQPL